MDYPVDAPEGAATLAGADHTDIQNAVNRAQAEAERMAAEARAAAPDLLKDISAGSDPAEGDKDEGEIVRTAEQLDDPSGATPTAEDLPVDRTARD